MAGNHGLLASVLEKTDPNIKRELTIILLGKLGIDAALPHRLAAAPEIDRAFKLLAPHMTESISKWTPEERAPLYVCPAGLDPSMKGGGPIMSVSQTLLPCKTP